MLPSAILSKCLSHVFKSLHQSTVPVIFCAIDALGQGCWLTMTEIARHWPHAERVSAPLKAADRLLRSAPLSEHRQALYGGMARWLIRESRPLIAVDWSDLKSDARFKLLRAGLTVHGRTLTLLEKVCSREKGEQATAERHFLHELANLLPLIADRL